MAGTGSALIRMGLDQLRTMGAKGCVVSDDPEFPEPPSDVTATAMHEIDAHTATVRLTWQPSPSPVAYYNVYHLHADDTVTWLGATPNTAYFVGNLVRDGNEATSQIIVVPIGADFEIDNNGAGTAVPCDDIFADSFDG